MEKDIKEQAKAQIFNVIILDKSGSMNSIRKAAINGFNETLASIKKAQEKYADTQKHFVTLVAFCGCGNQMIFDKVPANEANPLTAAEYEPCCTTPLFDAMGFTLTSMQKHVKSIHNALVVVTIITDGEENASKEYNGKAIKSLVESLKNDGWTFTYMGANQDSIEVAISLSIRNARNFDYCEEGTKAGFAKESSTRMNLFERMHAFSCRSDKSSPKNFKAACSRMADEAFDEEAAKA